jgi:hypothetical protein
MIKGLMGNQGVIVSGGDTALPYVNPNPNNPMTGMLRINNTNIEVFNGSAWQMISSSYATVSLDPETQDLLQWVRTQRTLELNRQTLMKNNPALEKAYEAMKRAEDNFDILATIAGEYEHVER